MAIIVRPNESTDMATGRQSIVVTTYTSVRPGAPNFYAKVTASDRDPLSKVELVDGFYDRATFVELSELLILVLREWPDNRGSATPEPKE